MKKTLFAVVILAVLFLLSAALIKNDTRTPIVNDPIVPTDIVVEGRQICLPHKDTSGPQTNECALGIVDEKGNNYSLDLEAVGYDALPPTDGVLRIKGVLTLAEALDTDFWQKYDMVGIITVTEVTEL